MTTLTHLPRPLLLPALLALAVTFTSCAGASSRGKSRPTQATSRPPHHGTGKAGALQAAPVNDGAPTPQSYRIRHFELGSVLGGAGYPAGPKAGGPYRAKLTLFFSDCARVAELYFYDVKLFRPAGMHRNFDHPCSAPREDYFKLHFPITTLDPILQQLHHSRGPLYLNRWDGEWLIQTTHGDDVETPSNAARRRR